VSALDLFAKSAGATLIEGLAIHRWLRLHHDGDRWRGLASLAVGETLETVALVYGTRRAARTRWGELEPAGRTHSRKVDCVTGIAGVLEGGIWGLWRASVDRLDSDSTWERTMVGGLVLFVPMHLKHQVENAAIRDTPFANGLFSPTGLFASAMEVAGAGACLALVDDGRVVLAGVALGSGLMIEHLLLLRTLAREIAERDVRRPRDRR
jgi:hypothetical protein